MVTNGRKCSAELKEVVDSLGWRGTGPSGRRDGGMSAETGGKSGEAEEDVVSHEVIMH